jgi:steroid delta-isomerase-like uncharacterized protein
MTPAEIVAGYYRLLSEPDRARLEELVDEDFVLRDEPVSWHIDGREDLWRLIEGRGGDGANFSLGTYVGDTEAGAIRWTWRVRGTQAGIFGAPTSDLTATIEGVAWVTFRAGRLRSLTEFWDGASPLRQFGAEIPATQFPLAQPVA